MSESEKHRSVHVSVHKFGKPSSFAHETHTCCACGRATHLVALADVKAADVKAADVKASDVKAADVKAAAI